MRRPALLSLASLCAACLAAPSRADVLCVRPGGGGGCLATIGAALAAAGAGDVIRVSAGTYTENPTIDENVTVEGGWNAAFTSWDPAANVTTIQPADAQFSVVDIEGSFANPSASTPVFAGFTVTGGRADLGGNHGGGIRIRDSHATVRDSVVTGNRGALFGGGIWVQRGTPRFERVRVADNVVVGDGALGGGIDLEGTAGIVEIVDTVIRGNAVDGAAGRGGGLFASGGVSIRGGLLEDNAAATPCGGTGGAIYSENAALEVRSARLIGNCAASHDQVYATDGHFYSSLFVSRPPSTSASMLRVESYTGGPSIHNCTFVWEGGGPPRTVEFYDDEANAADIFPVSNSIFDAVSTATIDVARLYGQANVYWNGGLPENEPGFGYTVQDPMLDASYHLTPASPLVDAGVRVPAPVGYPEEWFRDVDGELRPTDGGSGRFRMDVGADELAGPAQRVEQLFAGQAPDLTVIGPGNPPENPDSTGTNDWIGYSVLAADVTADGHDDLLFSAQDWAEDFDTLNAPGRVFGFRHFGARRTGVLDMRSEPADFQAVCRLELQHLGESLAAGDLDGDGHLDLIASASDTHDLSTSEPMATALYGAAALGTGDTVIDVGALGDFAVRSPDSESLSFASEGALATGDLDDDGIDDLVVGDHLADDGASADVGAVYVFFGDPTLGGVRNLALAAADLTLYGPSTTNPSFGSGPYGGGLALGDLDDDGQLDLAVRDATRAFVLFGPLGPGVRRLATQPVDLLVQGLESGGVLAIDATGDGVDDLVLDGSGDPEPAPPFRSVLHVIAGPLSPGALPSAEGASAYTLTGITILGGAARALASGDVAGDARPELLVGAPEFPTGSHAYAIPPGAYGPGDVPVLEVASHVVVAEGSAAFRNLGWDVAAGDLDGDGRGDLVLGSLGVNDPTAPLAKDQDVGKVFVLYGNPVPEPGAAAAGGVALAALLALARRRRAPPAGPLGRSRPPVLHR